MRLQRSVVLLGGFLSLISAIAPGKALAFPLLTNGSFEAPAVVPGTFVNIVVGGEAVAGFTGWTIGTGDIDVVNLTAPQFGVSWAIPSKDGDQLLDLNGFTIGSISQVFATTIGEHYAYQFWYTNNPLSPGNESASVTLTDVGTNTDLDLLLVSHTSATGTEPDWKFATGFFTALGATTRITFASTSNLFGSSGGIFIDAVGVDVAPPQAVPEPSTLVMAGVGLVALFGAGARRRQASGLKR